MLCSPSRALCQWAADVELSADTCDKPQSCSLLPASHHFRPLPLNAIFPLRCLITQEGGGRGGSVARGVAAFVISFGGNSTLQLGVIYAHKLPARWMSRAKPSQHATCGTGINYATLRHLTALHLIDFASGQCTPFLVHFFRGVMG